MINPNTLQASTRTCQKQEELLRRLTNKDDEHRGSSGYARGRQDAPQVEMADNSTPGVVASE